MSNIQKLIKIADYLDKAGLFAEASQVDYLIRKLAFHHDYKAEQNSVPGLLERLTVLLKSLSKAKHTLGFNPTEMNPQVSEEELEEEVEVIEDVFDYHKIYVAFNEINDSLTDHIIPSATDLASSPAFRNYKYYKSLFNEIKETADNAYHGRIDGIPFFKEMPNYIADIIYKEEMPLLSDEEVSRLQAELTATQKIFSDYYNQVVELDRELVAGDKPAPITTPLLEVGTDKTLPTSAEETQSF